MLEGRYINTDLIRTLLLNYLFKYFNSSYHNFNNFFNNCTDSDLAKIKFGMIVSPSRIHIFNLKYGLIRLVNHIFKFYNLRANYKLK